MKAAPILLSIFLVVATVGAGAFAPDVDGDRSAVDADEVGPTQVDDLESPQTDGPPQTGGTGTLGAPAGAQLEPVDGDNTTRVLGIPDADVDRSEVRRGHADIGPAVGFGTNTTSTQLRTAAIERRIDAAETTDERQRLILSELSEIEQHEVTLNQQERVALEAYANGEIEPRELTIRLARVSMQSQALRERLEVVRDAADETPDFGVGSRANNLDFRLRTYEGPVRNHVRDVLESEEPADRVFVETGGEAVVLTVIHEDTYVREAVIPDRRDRSSTGSMDLESAENVTFANYPLIAANRGGADSIGSDGLFIVQVPHAGGELTTFVDGGSERVFKEYQRLSLGNVTGHEPVTDVQEGLNVTVDRSYPGGPTRVTVVDADTGEPVSGATVTVGDAQRSDVVGTTDADGQHWVLSPRAPYLLTVLGDGTTVARLEIQPTATPHIQEYEPENETG